MISKEGPLAYIKKVTAAFIDDSLLSLLPDRAENLRIHLEGGTAVSMLMSSARMGAASPILTDRVALAPGWSCLIAIRLDSINGRRLAVVDWDPA